MREKDVDVDATFGCIAVVFEFEAVVVVVRIRGISRIVGSERGKTDSWTFQVYEGLKCCRWLRYLVETISKICMEAQLNYTDHLALLYPAVNDFGSEFIGQNLLLVRSSPSRPTAHDTNVWAKQGFLRLFVFVG